MVQFTKGRTTGLGVERAWIHAFAENEAAEAVKRKTDAEIAEWMCSEFPNRRTKAFLLLRAGDLTVVQRARTRYNRGDMTRRRPPKVKSNRYCTGGVVCNPRFSGKPGVKTAGNGDGNSAT